MTRRLAIIGGGSSGLVTLKYALDELDGWEIVCFEKSDSVTGCWGSPPDGFVSTSTRYATQFACFPVFDAHVQPRQPDSESARERCPEFFCDQEYGGYLNSFADHFSLRPHIRTRTKVESLRQADGRWRLTIDGPDGTQREDFDAVAICTGLVDQVRETDCPVETLKDWRGVDEIRGRRVVVVGGGESGVDLAHRLARPELQNDVFLSLRSGIRVSPRYHPIRGVPSDFLRNRLLLSFDPGLRSSIGGAFVAARIRFQEVFERLFPHRIARKPSESMSAVERRKHWDLRLTRAAKGKLFDVYHNKTDDFLGAVGEGRIRIIGPNVDEAWSDFFEFQSSERHSVDPDLVVPAIGYRNGLEPLTGGQIRLRDFFLGCVHTTFPTLFAIGFARPVIGNIPSISEMQARFAVGVLSGRVKRTLQWPSEHVKLRRTLEERFRSLDTDAAYPVEMFPYCDELARRLGTYPSLRRLGSWRQWAHVQLEPASTRHYVVPGFGHTDHTSVRAGLNQTERVSVPAGVDQAARTSVPIYSPPILTLILLALKPLDFLVRGWRRATFQSRSGRSGPKTPR